MNEEPEDAASWFGREIKLARESRGWSQQRLASELYCLQPYVSKVETGHQLASPQFAEQCDKVFGTTGIYARLRERAADSRNPIWFIPYLKLEREARTICNYSSAFVTGLLQTPEYAEAVFRSARPEETATEIQERVGERLRRREIFERSKPPSLWVILHEAVLWYRMGGADVTGGQLRHLLAATESPHINIQVFPFSAGAPSRAGSFNVLTRQDGTEVLYQETYQRGQVHETPEVVAEARAAYERLRADALSRDESLALIRYVLEAHDHDHHPRLLRRDMGEVQLQRGERRRVRRMGPRVRGYRRRPRPGQQEP
ncbi:helix-turn-helix transcriptional regulator [Streptomyces sp. SAJ15]|uniref:helix-turn-helix domain-containing protein n=1 Tax=Streptomyces sp. SAJ15 TaxID=2011095 RepID=UPI0011847F23|nr:transcriptional regulator [Streptomyces sp. SAJ15]